MLDIAHESLSGGEDRYDTIQPISYKNRQKQIRQVLTLQHPVSDELYNHLSSYHTAHMVRYIPGIAS